MKINFPSNRARKQGSVLVITMTILAVVAIGLASYLVLVQTQSNAVARGQMWNSAMAVAEAGVEDAMAEINKGLPNPTITSPWAWTNNIQLDGWGQITNQRTSRTYTLSTSTAGSSSYTVTIDFSSGTPVINSAGVVPFTTIEWGSYGAPKTFVASFGAGTATNVLLGRRVIVQTSLSPLFSMAIIARSNINMNGQNTTIDSFNSTNSLYSTGGLYDIKKHEANGSVATDSSVVGDISLGNGNIYGHVYTGPGSSQSSVQVGSQGAVGDMAWNTNGGSGVESGYWSGSFNTTIADVTAPTYVPAALPSPATNGPYVGSIILSSGINYTASKDPGKPLVVSGPNPTTLWVQGSFSPTTITYTNGGSLILYLGTTNGTGDSLSISGNGTLNGAGYAANLEIFGLPSLTSISLSGNGALNAAVYAPEANFTANGGGTAGDSSGSFIVNSFSLKGGFTFHYDEALAKIPAFRGWIAQNWSEIKY